MRESRDCQNIVGVSRGGLVAPLKARFGRGERQKLLLIVSIDGCTGTSDNCTRKLKPLEAITFLANGGPQGSR